MSPELLEESDESVIKNTWQGMAENPPAFAGEENNGSVLETEERSKTKHEFYAGIADDDSELATQLETMAELFPNATIFGSDRQVLYRPEPETNVKINI